jgi:hypothetical protein
MIAGLTPTADFMNIGAATNSPVRAATSDQKLAEFALTNDPVIPVQPIKAITRKYDFRNISANEIDQFAQQLIDGGFITDHEAAQLLTFGATFLSQQRALTSTRLDFPFINPSDRSALLTTYNLQN